MHELSIALSLLDLVAEEAERRAARVVAVHVQVGPLSGVVPEALASAFELAQSDAAAPVKLVVEEMPLVARCQPCDADRTLASVQELICPVCGELTPDVVGGRELDVVALEVES